MRIASSIVAGLLISVLVHAQEASSQYTIEHQRRALDIYRTVIGFRTAETLGQVRAGSFFDALESWDTVITDLAAR